MTTKSGMINDGQTFSLTSPGVQGVDFPANGDSLTVKQGSSATVPSGYGVSLTSITLVAGASLSASTTLYLQANSSIGVTSNIQMAGGCIPSCSATSGFSSIYVVAGATLSLGSSNIYDDASGTSINGLYFWGQSQSNPANIIATTGSIRSGGQGGFNQRNTSWTYVNFNGVGNMGSGYCGTNASFQATSITWNNSGEYVMPIARAGCVNRHTQYSDFRNFAMTSGGVQLLINAADGVVPSGNNFFSYNTVSTDTAGGLTGGRTFQINATSVALNHNIFKNMTITMATSFGIDANISSNVFFHQNGMNGCVPGTGSLAGSRYVWNNNFQYGECSNAHYLQPATASATGTVTMNIFESNTQGPTSNQDGKIYLGAGLGDTSVKSGTVAYNIGIGRVESADLFDFLGDFGSTDTTNFNHNTIFYSSFSLSNVLTGWTVGETYAGRNGMMNGSVSNNLVVFQTTQSAAHIQQDLNAGGVASTVKIASSNCNGFYNIGGQLYQSTAPANWYGANDVQVWPNFADFTRDLTSWDASLGGVGTSTSAIAGLLQANNYGGTFNQSYTLDNLRSYIQDGFTPSALNLKYFTVGAGCDAIDIGAMPVRVNHSFFGGGL